MSFTSLLEPMTEEALTNIGPFPTISLTTTGDQEIFVNECVPLPPFKNIYKERPPTPGDRRRIYDKSYHTVTNAIMILSHGFTFNPSTGRRKSNTTFYNYTHMQKLQKQQLHHHEPAVFYKLGENSQNKHTNWERHTRQKNRRSTNGNVHPNFQEMEIKETTLTNHTGHDYFGCDVKTTKNILFSEKLTSKLEKWKLCETVSESGTISAKRIKTDYQPVMTQK
ncbi:hypothetical protein ScPMuIL_010511 [Solemya velum]